MRTQLIQTDVVAALCVVRNHRERGLGVLRTSSFARAARYAGGLPHINHDFHSFGGLASCPLSLKQWRRTKNVCAA